VPSSRGWIFGLSALALLSASSHGGASFRQDAGEWRYLPSVRGEILDRNGVPLAENGRAFNLYVQPRLYGDEVRSRLVELLALDAVEIDELDRRVALADDPAGGRAILVLENLGRRRAAIIDDARRLLGDAVEVHLDSRRRYPHGEMTAHLVGYASPATSRELAELGLQGDASELIGRHGVEELLDSWLRGERGVERADFQAAVAGHDVVLTVDLELARVAAEAIRQYPAAAVVVSEVETGRILALASRPSFDPNAMIAPGAREELWLEQDPVRPLVDRTLQPYAPGSTYKLATAVAGLEGGAASRDEQRTCTGTRQVGGYLFHDMGVHGTVDFVEALKVSCNVYFWTVAERVGIDAIAKAARDFGFGAPSGLGINGDAAGLVPDRTTYDLEGRDGLAHTLATAIGNGDVRVTAVQLAMAYGAVANGGRLFQPQLVRRIQTARGEVVEDRPPILRRRVDVSPDTLDILREGTWRAVNVEGGTGYAAHRGAIPMAGKTGTALPPRSAADEKDPADPRDLEASHAWFVGWAPADRPELLVVVIIEHGGVGGKVAAPVARAVMDRSFSVLRHQRRRVKSPVRMRKASP